MGLSAGQLRKLIIRDTLEELGDWSPAAENLLMGTAAQESGLGVRIKKGRSLGIYLISPAAHRAVWDKYLVDHPELASTVRGLAGQRSFLKNPQNELVTNLKYATAIAWLVYKRCGHPLPENASPEELARYWYRHFHRRPNGRLEDFLRNYHQRVAPAPTLVA
ncbi:MAG TPA: hypothetical protein DCZ13_10870 [Porticoccaceae bacterium]|nr:hypothetical protein [Porticoccaceae bacterium]